MEINHEQEIRRIEERYGEGKGVQHLAPQLIHFDIGYLLGRIATLDHQLEICQKFHRPITSEDFQP